MTYEPYLLHYIGWKSREELHFSFPTSPSDSVQISHLWQQGTLVSRGPLMDEHMFCVSSSALMVFAPCTYLLAGFPSPSLHYSTRECCLPSLLQVVGLPSSDLTSVHLGCCPCSQLLLQAAHSGFGSGNTNWQAVSPATSRTYHDIGGVDVVCAFPAQGGNANP